MHDLLAELIERGRSTGGLKGPLNIGRFDLAPRERSGGSGTGSREPQGGGIPRKQAWRGAGRPKKHGKQIHKGGLPRKTTPTKRRKNQRQAGTWNPGRVPPI